MARRDEISMPPVARAVRDGDLRDALEAIRDRLAAELERSAGQAAAAVAKELRAVMDAIEALPGEEADPVDELAIRRAGRRSDAAG